MIDLMVTVGRSMRVMKTIVEALFKRKKMKMKTVLKTGPMNKMTYSVSHS